MSGEPRNTRVDWFRSTLGIAREAPPADDARSRQDERLARVWGIGACDVCGRTIVLGEGSGRFRNGERVVEVCQACEPDVTARGYRRAA
jgi:hypothetical protein